MNLNDIIALAKQGYKPADIKELLTLADDQEPEKSTPEVKDDGDSVPDDDPKAQDPSEPVKSEPEAVDYKKLYEEEKSKLEKLQKENINKNMDDGHKQSIDDILANAVRGFM